MQLRWKNKRCTDEALRLMEDAVSRVVEAQASDVVGSEISHIPTAINNELCQHCLCVVVAPNAPEGCCFRGMECTQFELNDRVYNIGIVLRRTLKDTTLINPVPLLEEKAD